MKTIRTELYSKAEYSKAFGINRMKLDKWISTGVVACEKIGLKLYINASIPREFVNPIIPPPRIIIRNDLKPATYLETTNFDFFERQIKKGLIDIEIIENKQFIKIKNETNSSE